MKLPSGILSLLSLCVFASLVLSGCDSGSSSPSTGTLSVVATDAPLPPDRVTSAVVEVTKITIHGSSDAESGFVTIFDSADPDEEPIELELTELRNGVVAELSAAVLGVGVYRQLRVYFSDGYLELTNGNTYTTDDGTLKLSSQTSSGLKIFIDPPIEVIAGQTRTVCLDFDLTKTFRPQPADMPLDADTYNLGPVVRAASVHDTGEIRGTVEEDDGTGTLVPVEDATVHVLPAGETDLDNSIASTVTETDGSYAVVCLEEGLYDVLAVKDDKEDRADAEQVHTGMITTVDLSLEETP